MIPREAIERAIKGGWEPCEFTPITEVKTNEGPTGNPNSEATFCWLRNVEGEGCGFPIAEIALDPSFWQSLGKSLGWTEKEEFFFKEDRWTKGWHNEALKFYDLILTGRSTDEFWKEILTDRLS